MSQPQPSKETIRQVLQAAGRRGGHNGTHINKVRAGHAAAAKRLNGMADEDEALAARTADPKEAKKLATRAAKTRADAKKQERLAK